MIEITRDIAAGELAATPPVTEVEWLAFGHDLDDNDRLILPIALRQFRELGIVNVADFVHGAFRAGREFKARDLASITDGLAAGAHVLDAGCGWGGLTRLLVNEGVGVVAVDHARAHAVATKLACPAATVYQGDIRQLSTLPTACFDLAIMDGVIEHVGDRQEPTGPSVHNITHQLAALREVARVIRPGGRLWLSTGNYLFPRDGETNRWLYHWLPPDAQAAYGRKTGMSADGYWLLTWRQLHDLLRSAGLEVKDVSFPATDQRLLETLHRLPDVFGQMDDALVSAWRTTVSTDPRFFPSWVVQAIRSRDAGPSHTEEQDFAGDGETSTRNSTAEARWVTSADHSLAVRTRLLRLREVLRTRELWIWGAGDRGRTVLNEASALGLPVGGVLDTRLAGGTLDGRPIVAPAGALAGLRPSMAFVVLAATDTDPMEAQLENAGFSWLIDYVSLAVRAPQVAC